MGIVLRAETVVDHLLLVVGPFGISPKSANDPGQTFDLSQIWYKGANRTSSVVQPASVPGYQQHEVAA